MSKDVTVAGASFQAVPAIILPQTGGGSAAFYDVSGTTAGADDVAEGKLFYTASGELAAGTASGGGGDLVHLGSFPSQTYTLAETAYNTWTPKTSQTTMLASADVGTFTAENIHDTCYYFQCRIDMDIKYVGGTATAKGMLTRVVGENWQVVSQRPNGRAGWNNGTRTLNNAQNPFNIWFTEYYNTAWTGGYNLSYGIYQSNTAATFSSTSAASPTVTCKRPLLYCRCHTTYFTTAMAAAVDKEASTITLAYDYYKADGGFLHSAIYDSMVDVWTNGLS